MGAAAPPFGAGVAYTTFRIFTPPSAIPTVPQMSTQVTPAASSDSHDYVEVQATPEFAALRKTLRGFIFPMTVAFFVWYALYVILSAFARGFMGTKVVGNINVALIFGLLQFVTTFLIAWLYARYMGRNVDPLARGLEKRYDDKIGGAR